MVETLRYLYLSVPYQISIVSENYWFEWIRFHLIYCTVYAGCYGYLRYNDNEFYFAAESYIGIPDLSTKNPGVSGHPLRYLYDGSFSTFIHNYHIYNHIFFYWSRFYSGSIYVRTVNFRGRSDRPDRNLYIQRCRIFGTTVFFGN